MLDSYSYCTIAVKLKKTIIHETLIIIIWLILNHLTFEMHTELLWFYLICQRISSSRN